jgi:hypothetical protein
MNNFHLNTGISMATNVSPDTAKTRLRRRQRS